MKKNNDDKKEMSKQDENTQDTEKLDKTDAPEKEKNTDEPVAKKDKKEEKIEKPEQQPAKKAADSLVVADEQLKAVEETVEETVEDQVVADEPLKTVEETVEDQMAADEPLKTDEEILENTGETSENTGENETAQEPKEKKKRTSIILIGAAVLLLLALIIGSVFSAEPVVKEELNISSENIGIFSETGEILVKGLEEFSAEEVQEYLTFKPEIYFTVEKNDKGHIIKFSNYRNIGFEGVFEYTDKRGVQRVDNFIINGPVHKVSLESNKVQRYDSVVLRFNEQVDPRSFEENFTITPETDVSISYDLDYIYIYPTDGWETTSYYQMEIDSAYTSKTGKQLAYNEVLAFSIVKKDGISAYYPEVIYHNSNNFIITDDVKLVLSFTGRALGEEVPVIFETYRLGDVAKFKEKSEGYLETDKKGGFKTEIKSLEKIATESFAIQEGPNKFELKNPGVGAYIVKAIAENPNKPGEKIEFRTGYLITPYTLYLQSTRNETLAWLNDGKTSKPVEGYTISFDDAKENSAVTDQSGIAIIPNMAKKIVDDKDEENYRYCNEHSTQPTEISVYNNDNELVYYDDAELRKEAENQSVLYYSFLFLDRSVYRPTDTINFWGYLKPFRTTDQKFPETIEITLDRGGLDEKVEVKLNQNGVFTGSIDIEKIKSSQYSVDASFTLPSSDPEKEDSNISFASEYISVKEFQKPSFVIETTKDAEYYTIGETVTVDIHASFYDGTPLPNYPLEAYYQGTSYGDWKEVKDVVTDSKGNASYSFKVQNDDYYGVSSNAYRVKIANDGEDITNVGYYDYIASDRIIQQTIRENKDKTNLEIEVRTFEIDTKNKKFTDAYEKAKKENEYFNIYQIFYDKELLELAKGKPKDVSVDLEILWNYFDEKYINHQNRMYNGGEYIEFDNSYSMDYTVTPGYVGAKIEDWETKEKKITIKTENGVAVIPDIIYMPEGAAKIDFSQKISCRSWANTGNSAAYSYYPENAEKYDWGYYDSDDKGRETLSFKITDKETGENLTPASSYYRNISLDIDRKVNFELMLNDKIVTKKGTILYTTVQEGLYDYHIVDANSFDFSLGMELSPNILLTAAYFDGIRIHYIDDLDIRASSESREVNVEITADKENYRPGEVAKLKIKATDFNDKPVAGNMVVSVVDEAIFAVSEQYVSVLGDLNQRLYYLDNYAAKYATTYRSGGANTSLWDGGKGEGDGGEFYDSYRSNFKDTAHFISTRTDANGESTVEFTMPDNITSWRITAIEIGDQLYAGHSTYNVISTQPFFVKPVITSKYIDGDEICLLVQGHGISLAEGDKIDYDVTLKGANFEKTLTHTDMAYQPVEFNFGTLPIGSYTLVAKGSFGGYSDTVEIPVHVIKSNLELVVNKPFEVPINTALDVNAARYPVSLTVYDKESEPFFKAVDRLFGHYCMMPSQRMSRYTAKKVLKGSFEDEDIPYYIREGNDSIADMQQYDGGIGAAADTESELVLSMYLTLIDKEQFNQNILADYFRGQLDELHSKTTIQNAEDIYLTGSEKKTEEDKLADVEKAKATCYLALAALGKVEKDELLEALGVNDSGEFLDTKTKMRTDTKAYYIAALAYIGEDTLAKKLYDSELKASVTALNVDKPYVYNYRMSRTVLNNERNLSCIWVAASMLDSDDADKLSDYFSSSAWMYRSLFDAMVYVINYDEEIVAREFSYTLNGETITKKIGVKRMQTITLNAAEMENIRFTNIDEGLDSKIYYVGEPEEAGIENTEGMSVSKTIKAIDENTYEVTIELNLPKDAPRGVYDISDWVPSNSRLYEKHKADYDSVNYKKGSSYMYNEEQKVYIVYNHKTSLAYTEVITYKIRQTYAGSAMLDRVYVIHGESGYTCSSEKEKFVPENPKIETPIVSDKKD